jgi:hypothetical protein
MKTKHLFITLVVLAMISPACHSLVAQDDYVKKYDKTYKVDDNTSFSIENKYGNIDIRDWDKSSLEINAEIILKDLSTERAEKLAEMIHIEFSQEGDNISVKTDYDDDFFRQLNRSNNVKNNKFEVNYIVMLPAGLKINATNKYGNIFINNLTSASTISLKYGTLKINQIMAEDKDNMANLELGYSKGSIEACKWLKIDMKYSKLDIQKSKALLVVSKYSKLYMDAGTSLIADSKYDTYEVGEIQNLIADARYSTFKLGKVSHKINLDTEYTEVKIAEVPAGFTYIKVENRYGSIHLGIDPQASYQLAGFAKYAKISYPDDSRVNRIQENNKLQVDGLVGRDSNDAGKVSIETEYGGVSLY